MQVMHAYASMRMLMQVMCMLKCMFNMSCKYENAYASYVYA